MPDIIARYESCSVARPLTPPPSLSVCVPLPPHPTPPQLISSDADGAIQRAGRFRVENGSSDEVTRDAQRWGFFLLPSVFVKLSPPLSFFRGGGLGKQTSDYTPGTWRRTDVHLENPEYHTRWFFKYFLGKGQCVRVRRRGLNAAAGSPRDERPPAVGMKVSSVCMAFPLRFTKPISSGQVRSSLSTT